MIEFVELARGARYLVVALGCSGENGKKNLPYFELRDLIAYLEPRDLVSLDRIFERAAEHGPGFSTGHAKRLCDSELYEFRTRRGTRLFWIYGHNKTIVCLSGYLKRSGHTPKAEMIRAEVWRGLYIRWRKLQERHGNGRFGKN